MTNLSALLGGSSVPVGGVITALSTPSVSGQTYLPRNGGSALRATFPALSAIVPVGTQSRPLLNWNNAGLVTSLTAANFLVTGFATDGTTYALLGYISGTTTVGKIYTSTNLTSWTLSATLSPTGTPDFSKSNITYNGLFWSAQWSNTTTNPNIATSSNGTTWNSPITCTLSNTSSVPSIQLSSTSFIPARAAVVGTNAVIPMSNGNLPSMPVSTNSGTSFTSTDVSNGNSGTWFPSASSGMNAVSNGTAILCFNAGAGGTLPSAYSVCTTGFATASNWTFYGAPPWALTAGAIGDVISTPTNNAFLLAAGGGSTNSSGAATLWRSTNNGTSWTPIITSSLLAMGLFVIGTKIYVWGRSYQTGTNSAYAYSIYVSNDDGLTFNPVSNPSTYNINPSGFFQISSSVSIYPYGGFVYHSGSGNVLTLTNFSAAAATLVYNAPEWTDSTNVWLDNVPNQYVRVA